MKVLMLLLLLVVIVVSATSLEEEESEDSNYDCTLECAPHSTSCHALENSKKLQQSGRLAEQCTCPINYGGIACDVPLTPCTDDDSCAACTEDGYCLESACDSFGSEQAKFACRKRLTEYCDSTTTSGTTEFCTNGGKCTANYQHENVDKSVLCKCPKEFTGPHCEFAKLPASTYLPPAVYKSNNTGAGAGAVIIIVAFAAAAAAVATLLVLRRRRRREQEQKDLQETELHSNSSGYKDVPAVHGEVL